MALVQASDKLLRDPMEDPRVASAFDPEEFKKAIEQDCGLSYFAKAISIDRRNEYTRRDPYMLAHYPLFDEIEECEKRAVERMALDNQYMQRLSTYEGAYTFYDNAKNWAYIYIHGCEELQKDHPELSTGDAIRHCNLLFYLYVPLRLDEKTVEYLKKKYHGIER